MEGLSIGRKHTNGRGPAFLPSVWIPFYLCERIADLTREHTMEDARLTNSLDGTCLSTDLKQICMFHRPKRVSKEQR